MELTPVDLIMIVMGCATIVLAVMAMFLALAAPIDEKSPWGAAPD